MFDLLSLLPPRQLCLFTGLKLVLAGVPKKNSLIKPFEFTDEMMNAFEMIEVGFVKLKGFLFPLSISMDM